MSTQTLQELADSLRRWADAIEDEFGDVPPPQRHVGDAGDCAAPVMREAADALLSLAQASHARTDDEPVAEVNNVGMLKATPHETRTLKAKDKLYATPTVDQATQGVEPAARTHRCEAFPECGCVPDHVQKAIHALNHVLDCLLRDSPDEIQASELEQAVAGLYTHPAPASASEPTNLIPPGWRKVNFMIASATAYAMHSVMCPDAPTLTASGLAIKAAASRPANYQLYLEMPGEIPDRAIADGEAVVLAADGSTRFRTTPPANY